MNANPDTPSAVQIPSNAVHASDDLGAPTTGLLRRLNLLPDANALKEASGPGAVLGGPHESVALIEAGATALSKWWSASGAAVIVAAWGGVAAWFPEQDVPLQVAVVAGAAFVTAAAVAAIGYLLASDVRGRAAATVATLDARSRVAVTMVEAAREAYSPPPAVAAVEVVPMAQGLRARYTDRPANDEDGWRVLALERGLDGDIKYVIVKGSTEAKVPASSLEFEG